MHYVSAAKTATLTPVLVAAAPIACDAPKERMTLESAKRHGLSAKPLHVKHDSTVALKESYPVRCYDTAEVNDCTTLDLVQIPHGPSFLTGLTKYPVSGGVTLRVPNLYGAVAK